MDFILLIIFFCFVYTFLASIATEICLEAIFLRKKVQFCFSNLYKEFVFLRLLLNFLYVVREMLFTKKNKEDEVEGEKINWKFIMIEVFFYLMIDVTF